MVDLPPARLAAFTRPFTHVGIDYFGPIEVAVGRRVEKRWGMIVTCLTVRVIHLEVVHSLSTSSCIMGLRNIMARRGTPQKVYSDRVISWVQTESYSRLTNLSTNTSIWKNLRNLASNGSSIHLLPHTWAVLGSG